MHELPADAHAFLGAGAEPAIPATRCPGRAKRGERLVFICNRSPGHGHWNRTVGMTTVYRQGIDNAAISDTLHARRRPMIPSARALAVTALATGALLRFL